MSPQEVYHFPLPRSEFCSRWSCLFSNITAAWIAPVNINAPQLHYLYLPRGIANLFCKWERKDMWYVQAGRSIGLSISLTTHRNKSFPLFPEILSAVLLLQMVVLHSYFFHLHSMSIMIQRISGGYEMAKIIFYHRLLPGAADSGLIDIQIFQMLPLISPASNLATQINVSVKRFNPFGKFDFQILMILFLPLAPLNTQFIFSKHVESVILLWKYFVPMQNHFCEISFHSENAPNKLTICLFLTSCYHMHVHIFFFAKPAYSDVVRTYLFSKPAYPDVTGLGVW